MGHLIFKISQFFLILRDCCLSKVVLVGLTEFSVKVGTGAALKCFASPWNFFNSRVNSSTFALSSANILDIFGATVDPLLLSDLIFNEAFKFMDDLIFNLIDFPDFLDFLVDVTLNKTDFRFKLGLSVDISTFCEA